MIDLNKVPAPHGKAADSRGTDKLRTALHQRLPQRMKEFRDIVANLAASPASLPHKAPAGDGKLVDATPRYYKRVLDASVDIITAFQRLLKPLVGFRLAGPDLPAHSVLFRQLRGRHGRSNAPKDNIRASSLRAAVGELKG
jgi:hypothetical protein